MRRRLLIRGIVQGVGFRPWVHQLARAHGLTGFVLNSSAGVTIEIEGPEESQTGFLADFRARPPELAVIDEVQEEMLAPEGYADFEIHESREEPESFALVPADVAVCGECVRDFSDPENRRYGYPFTNCTNCGPRYTIIRDIPYDRRFTTMAAFTMCAECEAEYHDPANRRFHAQPNACPVCGPWVELWDRERRLCSREEAIAETRRVLASGQIVAIKGLGGFHLACDAANDAAVRLLRERKRRSDNPFAIMAPDVESVRRLCQVTDADGAALLSLRRPIVLMESSGNVLSPAVAPGLTQLGVMLPYTPLHHLLFDGAPYGALVMTSGNLSEEPIASLNEEAGTRLRGLADFFLLHNRDIQTRVDDSVVRTFEGRERTLRRSRGFAPRPIDLGVPVAEIVACGGELKNVLCLTKGHYALLSQHIGDLENLETLEVFQETLEHMQRFFRVTPRAVAYDLHPQYLSTRMAMSMEGVERIGVQHHHAHIAACMAENRLDGKVIGIALDGTGYGIDGKIWGGEALVADYAGFERRAHFRYVPLPGGDTAIRQPWRSGLAYLRDAGVADVPAFGAVAVAMRAVVERMLANRLNTVETSSCGRLFDAVAAILGVRLDSNYEGQAAMQLEAIAQPDASPYGFDFDGEEIDFRETIRGVVADLARPGEASGRFHATVARAILEACRRIGGLKAGCRQDRLPHVCLSGGSFQNMTLLRQTVTLLRKDGFEVFIHSQAPPNDGGLALGQAVVANAVLKGLPG